MKLKSNWDNDQVILHAFTDAEVNKNFNGIYKEFKDHWFSIRGFTKSPSCTWL